MTSPTAIPHLTLVPDPTTVRAQQVVEWARAVRDMLGEDAAEFFMGELLRTGYVRGAA